jgi:hypothetical protein
MGRIRTNVLVDPSPRQVVKFAATVPTGQLRGTACSGKLIVYPAWDATHIQMRRFFELPPTCDGGSDFWVVPEGADPLSPDWYSSGEEPVRNGVRLVVGSSSDDPALAELKEWFFDAVHAQSFTAPG